MTTHTSWDTWTVQWSTKPGLIIFVFHLCSMTLDTPGNRKGMPDADFTQWTPLEYVAK